MILEDRLNGNGNSQPTFEGRGQSDFDFDLGDQHIGTSLETPMKPDAFAISDEEKMNKISNHFAEIMDILGLDLEDDSLGGTPRRVAKMFVKEIFYGLDPKKKPKISLFENKFGYRQMLVEKDITVKSFCEHHFLPITGRAHVAYIANGKVIGLSKLNRIVDYYARRPQVQERLTMQIAKELKDILDTEDVAVYIEAQHMCVQARGIEDEHSSTVTTEYSGKFLNENVRAEFLQSIR
ncbi:MAG: GTP cyclohydrolase I FolE [Saprospiraceae bacterium]|nr:GTP cyclohydrolase I FolE [Saprospiraceae bacterium]